MACTASAAIPTISLQGHGDTGNGGEPAAASLDDLAAQVLSACTMSGFFYLTDVAEFADNLETQAWKAAESLFLDDGADARQQRMASRDRQGHTGYTALHEEKLDLSNSAAEQGDFKESFYIARLSPEPRQTLPPALHAYHDSLNRFFEACKRVCAILLRGFARALGLDDGFFASRHHAIEDRLRLIHYPPAPVAAIDSTSIRAGAHSDYGSITLLFQREVGGLQVLLDGQWTDVPPKQGAIVVNVADALEFWTAGLLRSTEHRVVAPRSEAETVSRFSIAYFCQPDPDALLEPLENVKLVGSRADGAQETVPRPSRHDFERVLQRKGIDASVRQLTGGQHLQARLGASYA